MKRTLVGSLLLLATMGLSTAAGEDRVARTPSGAAPATRAAASPAQAVIERAAAARKFIFVFFWKEKNPQADKTWGVVEPALAKMAEWADLVAVQVTDPAEKQLVHQYGVSRAPMPLVLAIAPCGVVTKAFSGKFDEAQLRTAFVSPCTQLCLKALQDGKLVLLCVTDRGAANDSAGVPQGVQDFKADERYGRVTEIVLMNASDEGEAGFLKELQVNPRAPKPLTVLLAPPGSVIGQFEGRASKEQLVAKLVAAQNNPCAGGKCGPNGCGPKK